MSVFDAVDLSAGETVARLSVGLGLGAAIGLQREWNRQDAGLRTHALLALGSALFGIISVGGFGEFVTQSGESNVQIDVTRVASYVVAGIGFLAGGAIVKNSGGVRGLTTAGSLFVTAGVGLAAGLGIYVAAIAAAVATIAMLAIEGPISKRLRGQGEVSFRVVVRSFAAGREVASLVESEGGTTKRLSTTLKPEGTTEIQMSGVPTRAAETLIERLLARDDIIEITYSPD